MGRSHRQIEHTADLAFELRGTNQDELLRAGMEGVIEILVDGAPIEPRDERQVSLSAVDDSDRLVRWLNEVLYLAAVDGFVASTADFELSDGALRAVVRGEADARARVQTEIKSATYHDLQLRQDGDGWFARVVLDV